MKNLMTGILLLSVMSCEVTQVESQLKKTSVEDSTPQILSPCAERLYESAMSRGLPSDLKIVDGQISTFIADYKDGTHEELLKFKTRDNDLLDLDFQNESIKKLPRDVNIQLAMKGEKIYQVDGEAVTQTDCINREDQMSSRSTRYTNKDIGLYFMRTTTTERSFEEIQNRAQIVKSYYTQVADGKWTVNVTGYDVHVTCEEGESCSAKFDDEVNRLRRLNNHNYTSVVYSGGHGRYCGLAQIGGTYARNWGGMGCTNGTWVHELGHNFGLHHASTETSEYGDSSSIMGRSSAKNPLNAPQMDYLNLGKANYTENITETKRVFVAPLEWSEAKLYEGLVQIPIIVKNNRKLYFSVRGSTVDDQLQYGVHRTRSDDVYVHTFTSDKHSIVHTRLLSEGNEYVDSNLDVKIIHAGFREDGVVAVDVYYNTSDDAPSNLPFPTAGDQCEGGRVQNAVLCEGDANNLMSSLNLELVDSCSDNRKCELVCAANYRRTDDGMSCESVLNASCTGATPANAELCEGDMTGVEQALAIELVDTCSVVRKCEYKCKSGFYFDGDRCIVAPDDAIEIRSSKERPNGEESLSYSLSSDSIYWRIIEAGPNAKACIQYQAESRGNWGRCENLPDDSSKWYVMKNQKTDPNIVNPWYWSEQYEVWALTENLTETLHYIPGRFKMFWYNPDTGRRGSFEYQITP